MRTALPLLLAAAGLAQSEPLPPCNGAAALCARRYDEVAFATTHNAMSSLHDHWFAPNQRWPIARQLADGIRALMLDVHDDGGVPHLCHGPCALGKRPLVDALAEIAGFLDSHPREIVTLILECYVDGPAVVQCFEQAKLARYAHAQERGLPWPTLGAMIAAGKRLVVFTDRAGGAPAWYHPVWGFCFDTPWQAAAVADLTTEVGRGSSGNDLLILNHFLSDPFPAPWLARRVNRRELLLSRVRDCVARYRRAPSFVAVDWYTIGDVLEVVASMNAAQR